MRLNAAWDRSTGAGVRVAVIDTGITTHRDLAGNVIGGYDFVSDLDVAVDGNGRDNNPQDPGDWCDVPTGNGTERIPSSWHGTHVAGIVAAQANNGLGVAGVAYGAKVQPVRALGACGGWESDIADAIVWAAGGSVSNVPANPTPAKVINLSLGADGACDGVFQSAIDTATQRGAVVVVAAGNEDQNVANVAPANCANVISVGATGRDGARALYSNFGTGVDVSAPGGDFVTGDEGGILSTWNSGDTGPASESYAMMEGTSMAAPHVAGAAALMLSLNPALSPAQVESLMKQSARPLPVPCALGCGTGLVDGTAAVAAASASLKTFEAPTPIITGFSAVGYPLDVVPGSWTAGATLRYQWYRSGNPIFGATGSRHNVTSADIGTVLSVKVTGSKPGYRAASATSKNTLAVPAPFVDVRAGRIFHREISWMAARHISLGWNNDDGTSTYRPLLAVNRDVMARFMYRLAGSLEYAPPARSPFTDVPTTHVFYKEIAWLAESKVSEGWANRNGTRSFRPYEPVNRDVMAVFMYRLAGFNEYDYAPPARSPFVDVPTTHIFYKEIAWLAESKVSEGWSVGDNQEFRPYTAVNRDVMAAFMYRFHEKFDAVQLAPAP
nr:S8 family serine peptidase [Arthrobacter pigmenti]